MISSNLGLDSHRLATIHPWETTTTTDERTDRRTDDNRYLNTAVKNRRKICY